VVLSAPVVLIAQAQRDEEIVARKAASASEVMRAGDYPAGEREMLSVREKLLR